MCFWNKGNVIKLPKEPSNHLIWSKPKYFSFDENWSPPRHPDTESLRFVFKTLEARKTKSGLSALPRPSLDNEELVSLTVSQCHSLTWLLSCLENARVQEDAAGLDLPDLQHDAAQLCPLVRHLAHLLLRVRGPPLGHRQTGPWGHNFTQNCS